MSCFLYEEPTRIKLAQFSLRSFEFEFQEANSLLNSIYPSLIRFSCIGGQEPEILQD